MAPPWFVQDKKAGKEFLKSLRLKPTMSPGINGFMAESGASIESSKQVNGLQKPPAIGVSTKPTNPKFWMPTTLGSEASTAATSDVAARILFEPGTTNIADAQTQYSNWAANPVSAALVIIQTTTTDGTKTPPCLACVHCPTVSRRGHTLDDPWAASNLLPGMCPAPTGTVFPMAGTILQDSRALNPSYDPLAQGAVLSLAGAVSFTPLVTIASVGSVLRAEMCQLAGPIPDFTTLWRTKSDIAVGTNSFDFVPTANFLTAGDSEMAVVLPRAFPLSLPCIIPPGIIGDISAIGSMDKLCDILRFFLKTNAHSSLSLLNLCPLLHEWLHAAHTDSMLFLTDWVAFNDIKESFTLTNTYATWQIDYDPSPFREQQYAFLLQQLMLTLAWRIHLDWIRAGPASHVTSQTGKRFEHYLKLAWDQAFSLQSCPLGQAPIELVGELAFLRPLNKKKLAQDFDLAKFTVDPQYLPLMARIYVPYPVTPYIKEKFVSVPLFTAADTAEAIDETSADLDEPDTVQTSPEVLAYVSSVKRKKREETIIVDATPQRKMPPRSVVMVQTGRIEEASLPPIGNSRPILPNCPPPPLFAGRQDLPMSPTRTFRVAARETQQTMAQCPPGLPPGLNRMPPPTLFHANALRMHGASSTGATSSVSFGRHWEQGPLHPSQYWPRDQQGGFPSFDRQALTPRNQNPMFAEANASLPRPRTEVGTTYHTQRPAEPPRVRSFPAIPNQSSSNHLPDPSQWSLFDPDARQPPGHWFFSAILAYRFDDFNGFFMGTDERIDPICCIFVPHLWRTYQLKCFAPTKPQEARKWLAGLARERAASSRSVFQPYAPLIHQLPDEAFEAFRTGQWQRIDDIHSPAEAKVSFSAYTLLACLPEVQQGKECFFPADGVTYRDALLLLINFIWMISAASLSTTLSDETFVHLEDNTIILTALNRLHTALREVGSQGLALHSLWDSSRDTRHRMTLRMLRDIDAIIGCFTDLLRPFERPMIFHQVHQQSHAQPGAQHEQDLIILWPIYAFGQAPKLLSPSQEPPNLLQAVNTVSLSFRSDWQSYHNMQGQQLVLPPMAFQTDLDPPAQQRQNPYQQEPPLKKPKPTPEQGKQKSVPKQASTPILQWEAAVKPSDQTFQMVITMLQANKALGIPRIKTSGDGKPVKSGTLVCFPYLIKGLGCTCHTRKKQSYGHVEIAATEWTPTMLDELKKFMAAESVTATLTLTEKGTAFFA